MQIWLLSIWEYSSFFSSYWTYIPDAQDIFEMCPHWCLTPFWPVLVTHEFQFDSTAVHSTESTDNMKIQSVKESSQSLFCVAFYFCAAHLYMVNGSSKVVCNIYQVFRKLSLCISLPKSNWNERQNPEKEVCLVFKHHFLCRWLHECQFLKLSCERCVYAAHIQYGSQLSQLVCLKTLSAPWRGACCFGSNLGLYCCPVS